MDINLEYYKIFYYTAKQKSVTLAAEKLSISQPAVSQAIKHLEKDLGCALFVRTAKGVRLTKEGEMLFSYVERGCEAILSGEKRLLEMLNLEKGEICIGASDMTLKYYLLPYLERFHEKYPNIRVTVTNAPTPETLQHLADGRIDFGIVSSPVEPQGWLKIIPVKEIRDVFVAGKKYKETLWEKDAIQRTFGISADVFRGKHLDETLCGGIFRRRRCDGVPGIRTCHQ